MATEVRFPGTLGTSVSDDRLLDAVVHGGITLDDLRDQPDEGVIRILHDLCDFVADPTRDVQVRFRRAGNA